MQVTPIRPGKADVHVVPTAGGWAVKQEHLPTYTMVATTQVEAIAAGMRLAREGAALLVIHGEDGRFRQVWSYR